jgi:hypothetical protein
MFNAMSDIFLVFGGMVGAAIFFRVIDWIIFNLCGVETAVNKMELVNKSI